MDNRSRSNNKRNYYYDNHDYDNQNNNIVAGRSSSSRPRFNNNNNNNHHYTPNNHRYNRGNAAVNNRQPKPPQQQQQDSAASSSLMVTTSYRILCHDLKAGGVIGKSGSIIKSIRQHTGAWINVHELIPGDEERIIEISDTRRRDPDGRMPAFSPAQEALFLIHDRIMESDAQFGMNGGGYGNEEEEYGGGGRGNNNNNRVATRLVVSRMHVGCLLGKGGKIIEQMRVETKTQIRILPRDANLPRCVSMSEEIVQVVGEISGVKNAIAIISSRLRESQHRDRTNQGNFHGRAHSPERFYPDDDYAPHMGNAGRRSSVDGPSFGSRMSSNNYRNNNYSSRKSGYAYDVGAPIPDNSQPYYGEDLVFRMLCPTEKMNKVVGEVEGIVDLLQNEIGVDVKVSDPVSGSDEQIIIVSSEEGPDDELFPAQEALLHIQTRIVDLVPDKDNFIKTKLVVSSSEIGCLEGRDGSLSEMERLTGAKIYILPREKLPSCVSGADELVLIEGEIRAARDALVEVTSRLRSFLYKEFFQKDTLAPVSAPVNAMRLESTSPRNVTPARDGLGGGEPPIATYQTMQSAPPAKDAGGSSIEKVKQNDSERREDVPTPINRIPVALVTRSILEIVIPEHAVPKLVTKSKNKLAQISELSGANVTLMEDRPDVTEKTIQISGTPEQVERAQSLFQGFILSTQEDGP
ncbi:RNA-binding KH domain-containing protein [Euphorbia peplus]|nr:RNA-binding KH domain-containing protein [Euphorbia peplus]